MVVSVRIAQYDGRFTASIFGSPDVNGVGDSKSAALEALKAHVSRLQRDGELVLMDLPPVAVTDLVGKRSPEYREQLRAIVAEAYRLRDEEKAREFPA